MDKTPSSTHRLQPVSRPQKRLTVQFPCGKESQVVSEGTARGAWRCASLLGTPDRPAASQPELEEGVALLPWADPG